MIRTDRFNATQGSEIAIVIKKDILYEVINSPSSITNKILEYTIIKIPLLNRNNLLVISVYAKNDTKKLFINQLNTLLDEIKLGSAT